MSSRTFPQTWPSNGAPIGSHFTDDGRHYVAIRRGNAFEAVLVNIGRSEVFPKVMRNNNETGYWPVAPGTTASDVDGAVYAYDDGTYWHFGHAAPGQHHDTEAIVEAMLISHFQPKVNRAIQAVAVAGDITARTLANNYLDALNGLVEIVLDHAEKAVRALTLGEHARETPEKDNNRAVAVAAIKSAVAATKKTAESNPMVRYQLPALESAATAVVTELTATPTIETRTQRVARLAAEAKEKEAESEEEA